MVFCCLCLLPVTFIVAFLLYYIFLKTDPNPINNKYSQPGKWFWLKYVLMRLMLWRRKRQNQLESSKEVGYGAKSKVSPEEMDCVQKLSDHPKAIEAVFFNASNSDGYYFVCSAARRPNGVVQSTVLLRIPNYGVLGRPKHPDTTFHCTEPTTFEAGGLSVQMIVPMRQWQIKYKGQMKVLSAGGTENGVQEELVDVELDIDWNACTDYFDFDSDMNSHAMSRALALEPWSKEFFHRLEESHQTHYEQYGRLECHFTIKDPSNRISSELQKINLVGLRDHSFGTYREWRHFYRYGLQMFHLDDGSCIQAGVVSMAGHTMSRLEIGYLMKAERGTKVAVSSCDLALHENGERGEPLDNFEFNFVADGQNYHVKCEVIDKPVFYIGFEWEAKICERMCKFVVNGSRVGYGFSEFQYRSDSGRPVEFSDQ